MGKLPQKEELVVVVEVGERKVREFTEQDANFGGIYDSTGFGCGIAGKRRDESVGNCCGSHHAALQSYKRLDANTKSPCVDVTEYVDYVIAKLIRFEEENKREGFSKKIDALKKLRGIAKLNDKGILGLFQRNTIFVARPFRFTNNHPVEVEEEIGEDSDEDVEVEETDGGDSSESDSN